MSTRAIVAVHVEGGYETAWCWSDGQPSILGSDLKDNFKDEKSVKELVEMHSFAMIGDHEDAAFWKRHRLPGDRISVICDNVFVLQHEHHGNVVAGRGENGLFPNVKTMLDEDVSCVYVFENGQWELYL